MGQWSDDVRLSLRCPEDWDHLRVIQDALGAEQSDWQTLARLLDDQPTLRQRMAELNRGEAVANE